MGNQTLGIIGGGQLGSLLASAAKKINIKTVIFSDDRDAPGQKFSDDFVFGKYDDEIKINEFVEKVDIVTFEFENIPFETLNKNYSFTFHNDQTHPKDGENLECIFFYFKTYFFTP